ncbi:PKD domain-containing protein [Adhaeribacter sp. BT258]|uniref:PKD domain-containing protein n=1 Tax=Adhaeribacter terrigena TaxID=2793070 RepID=A0ABS1C2S0_9BACT|nr:PKD domain-containing protein [Adhaeribacter terrigena]MBK0403667.1 PKD domain-containing protein [Adhaeribacter terrigena]
MRKTFTLWAALGALFFSTANAQVPTHRTCGTVEVDKYLERTDPGYKARRAQNERAIQQFFSNQPNARTNVTRTIPVVFHVVYANATQNISQAQIMSQLDVLNEDFRKMNSDTTSIPGPFKQLAADTEIEFCLASVDPSGQPTTGITRTATTVSVFDYYTSPNQIKTGSQGGKDAWPNTQYLNIWIGNIGGGPAGSQILGYATSPGASAAADGVVLLYTTVGKPPHNTFPAPINRGRTATHEVGHWLDLKHIWGDEPGCTADDLVTDTPQQKAENQGCPTFPLLTGPGASCATTGPGAMYMNYMDYTDDNCMNMFTHGQKARMIAALTTSRASLLTSTACSNTLRANFSANNTTITAGNAVNFFDNSTGTPTGWSWSFPGGTPSTSTAQNPASIQYSAPGTYNVTLTVTKGTATDTRTINNFITVGNSVACVDTLNLPFAGTPVIYVSQTATGAKNGYVSGNNAYGHKAKAEKFVSNTTTINGGIFAFGRAKFATAASTVTVAVWNATGTNGAPGTIIASQVVPINTIAANIAANQLTTVTFTTPVAVTGNFYMGVVLPTAPGDTIALITNTHSTTAPAGKGWEQLSTNAWIPYSDPNGWSLNLSNAVFPIVAGGAPVVSFTSSLNTICSGNTVTFNSNATTGANTYNWSFPGGTPATSTQPNPTVTYNTPGNYNVTLTAGNSNCSLTTTVTQTNAISVVTPPPGPPVANFTVPSTTICVGSPVTFNGTSTTGATAYAWFFQGGSQTSSTLQSPTVTYNTPGTYNVTLTAHAGTGPCALSNAKTMTVNVVALPNVNITPASAVICTNPTQLTASGASTYTWSPATGLSATTGATVTANPSVTTVYTVTGTTSAGCVSTDTVRVIVPNITADFTPSGKYFDHRNGAATVTFTNNSANGTFYLWNFGEPGLSTANTSTLYNPGPVTYPYTGTFIVKLEVSANGCTEIHRDTIVVRNTTGLNEAFENGLIKIYPNPAKNYLQVEIPATEKVTAIQLTNAIGQVIAKQKPDAGATRFNVANLPAGIYFVKISNAEGSIIKKISIEQ